MSRAQQIAAQVSTQPRPVPVSLTDKENRDIKNLPEDKAQVEAARP
ncbi:MAG TPA: hypothetical protein VHV83_17470 [Armatimonadota bacterium]|nr:hypothetical protein [Armatimonadota bacterium]